MVSPSAVLCIRDERSRAVCSLLLRHQGFRAIESTDPVESVDLAVQNDVRLVIADLDLAERTEMHQALVARLPGVVLLFIHEKQSLDHLEQMIRSTLTRPADTASTN